MIKRTPFQIQLAVIFALLMRELKTRFGGHWTGVVWMLGEPLAKLAVLTWMYSVVRGRTAYNGYSFEIYLLVAMLPFHLFNKLWTQLMNGIKANQGLYGYKQVKPLDTLLARTLLEMSIAVVIFACCFLILWRLGFGPTWPDDFLAYVLMCLAFVLSGFGLGLLSAIGVYFMPRIGTVISLVSIPLQVLSGVIFPVQHLPREMLDWMLLNPLLHLVELARHAFLPGYVMVQGVNLTYPMVWILVNWTLGLSMYWLWRQRLAGQR